MILIENKKNVANFAIEFPRMSEFGWLAAVVVLFSMQICLVFECEDFFAFAWKVPREDQNVNWSQMNWAELSVVKQLMRRNIQYNQNLITLCDVAFGC